MLQVAVPPVVVDCVVPLFAILLFRLLRQRESRSLPPGPKGYPIIGNAFDMMGSEIWEAAQRWGDVFGGLIYLQSLGKSIVMINSYDIAIELLEKRSLNYSDRPHSVMLNELQRWDWLFSNLSYGEDWRKKRAPMQKFFELSNITHYEDVHKTAAQKLLRALLRDPKGYDLHIRASVASSLIRLVYGHEVRSPDDSYVTLAKDGFAYIRLALRQGAFLVDILPWLKYVPKWFPGAGFQSVAIDGAKASSDMRYIPYTDSRDKIFSGTAVPSFTSQQIEECLGPDGQLSKSDEDIISAASGICYVAGVDTSVSALMSFFLAMTLYPEVQKRAQDEIDSIVGVDRLPENSDQAQLPYCSAMCKELLRWQPAGPLGLAHATREDDTYAGYHIPAGTTIVPNQWAMLRDPEEYPEPDVFRPERFLPAPGGRIQRDPGKIAFGFGRRICAAKQYAENNIFLLVVQLLAVFSVSKVVGDDGELVEPIMTFTLDGIVRLIGRFECDIKPRSDSAAGLVALD